MIYSGLKEKTRKQRQRKRTIYLVHQCNIRKKGVSRVLAWKTGQSGNRKGRPRLDEVEKQNVLYFKQQLKKYSVSALEELFELMEKSINQDIRYKCATYILDRCYGKDFVAERLEEQNKDIRIQLITMGETYQPNETDEQEIWNVENSADWMEEDTTDDWGADDIYLG